MKMSALGCASAALTVDGYILITISRVPKKAFVVPAHSTCINETTNIKQDIFDEKVLMVCSYLLILELLQLPLMVYSSCKDSQSPTYVGQGLLCN